MAEATLSGVSVTEGTLHVYGSGFTRTTTTLLVNGESVSFEWISDGEITAAAPAAGATVEVEKGGIRSQAMSADETPPEAGTLPVDKPVDPEPETPVSPPSDQVETIESQGIGAQDPYPTGNPPERSLAEINGMTSPDPAA